MYMLTLQGGTSGVDAYVSVGCHVHGIPCHESRSRDTEQATAAATDLNPGWAALLNSGFAGRRSRRLGKQIFVEAVKSVATDLETNACMCCRDRNSEPTGT